VKALKMYNWDIQSRMENIRNCIEDIIYSLKNPYFPIDDSNIFELKVILNELFSNAIKHGNKGDCNKHIKVSAGLIEDGRAFIILEDEGDGYNYYSRSDVCQDSNDQISISDMKETGRGILLVRNLCDNVKFNSKGNKVIISKKLYKKD
jgi:serine/threonine-protein kinase RsbW